MEKLLDRLDQIERQIPQVKHKVARKDLMKMLRTIDTAIMAVDQESVECRRLHKETIRHRELVQTAEDLISNLERHLTFAVLMGG
jgi:7,8-dihydro-6-hydroxymethylpterin-pyrophosphokinase